MLIKRTTLIILLISLSACAGLKFTGKYNPSGHPVSQLAVVTHGKSFGQLFADSSTHQIVMIDGMDVPSAGTRYSKIEPGKHTVGWTYTEIDDLGFASYEVVRDSGLLVIELEPSQKYTIGISESGEGKVEVWNRESLEVVSQECNLDCENSLIETQKE